MSFVFIYVYWCPTHFTYQLTVAWQMSLVEHLCSLRVHIPRSLVFCVMFCRSLFVLFCLFSVASVFSTLLWFTTSGYPLITHLSDITLLFAQYIIFKNLQFILLFLRISTSTFYGLNWSILLEFILVRCLIAWVLLYIIFILRVNLLSLNNFNLIWILQSDWLIPPEKILVILDNLGWYCDVTNVFIRQRQIQIVTWNNRS